MPRVGNRHFAYTAAGKKAADEARQKLEKVKKRGQKQGQKPPGRKGKG